jgi:hypothetical protein
MKDRIRQQMIKHLITYYGIKILLNGATKRRFFEKLANIKTKPKRKKVQRHTTRPKQVKGSRCKIYTSTAMHEG